MVLNEQGQPVIELCFQMLGALWLFGRRVVFLNSGGGSSFDDGHCGTIRAAGREESPSKLVGLWRNAKGEK